MNGPNPDYCLEFHDYTTINEHVDPVTDVELHSSVLHWQHQLDFDSASAPAKFVCKACLIGTFQKAGTQRRVDFQGRIDDSSATVVNVRCQRSS